MSNWEIYNGLKEELISTQKFHPDRKMKQRVLYQEEFSVDLIPFGKIAGSDNSFLWPPENEIKMSTVGFKEAYNHSITVIVKKKPVLEIQFASLAGLAVLKLIAWNDNYSQREKDAKDLLLILRNYLDAGNQNRLYEDEKDLIEGEDFDYEVAGARLLGRDVALLLGSDSKEAILKLLYSQTGDESNYELVYNMLDHGADSSDFEKPLQLLTHLKKGVEGRV